MLDEVLGIKIQISRTDTRLINRSTPVSTIIFPKGIRLFKKDRSVFSADETVRPSKLN